MILDQAHKFFLACREFQCQGWSVFLRNFPFAFAYHTLPSFIKSLTMPALIQVRYLKIVVSECDVRYRNIWRYHDHADLLLAKYTFESHWARLIGDFPTYLRPWRDTLKNHVLQCRSEESNETTIGELLGLQHYILDVHLDLPRDDYILSQRAKRRDHLRCGYTSFEWPVPFPVILNIILICNGLLDGVKGFEPKVQEVGNGYSAFESDIRELLENARRDIKVVE